MAQAPSTEKKEEELSGTAEAVAWKKGSEEERWADVNTLLSRPSEKFCPPPFNPDEENYLDRIQNQRRVLVVGAGGLGCEILKNLALSGFKDIEVLDLDTIELSNLNRQFLFRKTDIDSAKAKCAAEFVVKRVPGCTIKWHRKKLEDFGPEFYKKFDCVIAGLDNVEARRWLNAMLYDLVEFDEDSNIKPETIIPFIDGGTEGFLGQVRLFIPRLSACFECSVGTMTPPKAFQSCTIASIPRRPEHCIAYAHKVLWNRLKWLKSATEYEMETDKSKPDPCGVPLDKDDVDHMSWIFNRATERAKEFNIEGVTYNLTMQVVKNIIPAIASTNALVSAACVNECLKALTWCSYGLLNYFMYMGQDGIYTRTFDYKQNPQCPVCGTIPLLYKLDGEKTTFENLYAKILHDDTLKLKDPSISVNGKTIFMAGKNLRALYEENMKKPISTLFTSGDVLQITDRKCLGKGAAKIKVEFEEGVLYVPPKED